MSNEESDTKGKKNVHFNFFFYFHFHIQVSTAISKRRRGISQGRTRQGRNGRRNKKGIFYLCLVWALTALFNSFRAPRESHEDCTLPFTLIIRNWRDLMAGISRSSFKSFAYCTSPFSHRNICCQFISQFLSSSF